MNKILITAATVAFMVPAMMTNASSPLDAPIATPIPATVFDVEPEVTEVAHSKRGHGHRHHYKAKKKKYSCRKGQHKHKGRNYCHSHRPAHVSSCPSGPHTHIRNKHGDIVKILAGGAILYGIYKHIEDKF